jgi:hypothetical protein
MYDTAGRQYLADVARHRGLKAHAFDAFLHAAKITHAVVDDRNHGIFSETRPLLEL